MPDHVVKFPIEVRMVSPFHIGSGDKIEPKWFTWSGQEAAIIDETALLRQVVERHLVGPFEQFCLDPGANAQDFLLKSAIALPDVVAYIVKCSDRPREILTFIKTRNRPFLPGSSLKGALRSSLLRAFFLQADEQTMKEAAARLDQAISGRRPDRLPGQPLEQLLFTGDEVPKERGQVVQSKTHNYDLLRMLGLSDSPRLPSKVLQVRPVEVLSAQTDKSLRPKDFVLYPEMITPGFKFKVQMKLDLSMLLKNYGSDYLGLYRKSDYVLQFAKHCRIAARHLLEQDAQFYDTYGRPRLADWCQQRLDELKKMQGNECLLPIGWGSGYDAKTVTDLFQPDLFETVLESYRNTGRLGRATGRGDWLGPDLSPKTRRVTEWNDEEVPLGWLRLRA